MRPRSWIGRAGALLIALVLSVAAALTAIVATERGSRWSLEQASRLLPALTIHQISGSWLQGLRIARLDWQGPASAVQINELSLQTTLTALLRGTVQVDSLTAASATVTIAASDSPAEPIELPRLAIPLEVLLKRASLGELRVDGLDTPITVNSLALQARWRGEHVQIEHARAAWPEGEATLQGEISLRGAYPLAMALNLNHQPLASALQAQLSGSLRQLRIEAHTSGRWSLDASASAQPLDPALPFTLKARTASPVHLETAGEKLDIDTASLQLSGNRESVQGDATLAAHSPRLGQGELTSKLNWRADIITLAELRWTQASGHTPLRADCDITVSERAWRCEGELAELALEPLLPVADGRLSSPFLLSGAYRERLALSLSMQPISGSIGGESLRGRLQLHTADAREWQVDEIHLEAGSGRLQASGVLGASSALTFSAQLPRLELINPALAGQLQLRGRVDGALKAPSLRADFRVEGGRYRDWSAQHIAGDIDLRQGGLAHSSLRVNLDQLASQQLPAGVSLSLSAAGVRQSTQWQLRATDPRGTDVSANCAAQMDDPPEQITIRCTRFGGAIATQHQDINVRLAEPLDITLLAGERHLRLAPFCLTADSATLCLREAFQLTPDTISPLSATMTALPIAWLAAYAPQQLASMQGSGINAELSVSQWAPFTARARLDLAQLHWRWQTPEEEAAIARVESIHVEADADAERVVVRAAAQSETLGRLHLDARIGEPATTRVLTGSAAIEGLQLGAFGWLYPAGYTVGGTLDADIRLSGHLAAPRASGRASLIAERIEVPGLNSALSDVRMTADLQPELVRFDGRFALGEGSGTLSGRLVLPEQWQEWTLEAQLAAEALEFAPIPDSTVTLSPRLSLLADKASVRLDGEVAIERADIRLQKLRPDVVRVSPDTEIAGSEAGADQSIYADVKVRLGDQFHFTGFGAQVRLAGQLRLRHDPARLLSAVGEVQIPSGRYLAYGQRLKVRDGSFLFHGPIDNPNVNLRAVRELPPDIKQVAGVHVTGALRAPSLTLFSEPPMPETEIAYYILTGQAPPETGQASGGGAQSALLNLGLAGATAPIARVAEQLGIRDLQIGATATEEHYQSMVSGYLSPRLYARYASGIGEKGSSITFQYRLTEQLILEAVTGVDQALDLLYTFHIR